MNLNATTKQKEMNLNLIMKRVEKNLARIQELEAISVNLCDRDLTQTGRQYIKQRISVLEKDNEVENRILSEHNKKRNK